MCADNDVGGNWEQETDGAVGGPLDVEDDVLVLSQLLDLTESADSRWAATRIAASSNTSSKRKTRWSPRKPWSCISTDDVLEKLQMRIDDNMALLCLSGSASAPALGADDVRTPSPDHSDGAKTPDAAAAAAASCGPDLSDSLEQFPLSDLDITQLQFPPGLDQLQFKPGRASLDPDDSKPEAASGSSLDIDMPWPIVFARKAKTPKFVLELSDEDDDEGDVSDDEEAKDLDKEKDHPPENSRSKSASPVESPRDEHPDDPGPSSL